MWDPTNGNPNGTLPVVEALRAAIRKEWRQEARSLSGLAVTGSFALLGGILGGVALYGINPDAQLLGGMIWLLLLFAGGVTLPRTFLVEDETGTADMMRMVATPSATFYGKAILASLQMLVVALLSTGPVLLQTGIKLADQSIQQRGVRIDDPLLLIVALALGAIGIGTTATLCGALASGAANRGAVAAALALPLLVFLASIGTTALLPAFGDSRQVGWTACAGMLGWVAGAFTIGPPILAAVWRR